MTADSEINNSPAAPNGQSDIENTQNGGETLDKGSTSFEPVEEKTAKIDSAGTSGLSVSDTQITQKSTAIGMAVGTGVGISISSAAKGIDESLKGPSMLECLKSNPVQFLVFVGMLILICWFVFKPRTTSGGSHYVYDGIKCPTESYEVNPGSVMF